ncbi:HlyD family type I secretion periplasmic adaptor subunit [Desulfovibrio sp. OttesenSCG-928-G15]|nr:HlyD family type I secretion periplasmic adaptor subunit [Desulfovibrio sp. OttesenSCG-928-G15]
MTSEPNKSSAAATPSAASGKGKSASGGVPGGASRYRLDTDDLDFMNEVDAAMLYRGSKWAYRLSFFLLMLFVVGLCWMYFTERNEVTRGEGQVTPSLGVQPVQSEQGGVIKEIFVKEGQEVKAGDKLVQMSNVEAVAEFQTLVNKETECILALKRLDAEGSGKKLVYSDEEKATHPDMVNDQLRLYDTRREKMESGTREIRANLEQKRRAVQESFSRRRQYEQNLLLLKQRVESVRPLVARKVYSEIDFLNLRQQVITQEGELNALAESIARTQSEVREEEARLANRDSEWQATIANERNDYRRQLDSIIQKIAAGSHMVQISDLRSPINGVIRRILLKEESVAQRAQAIMEILPTDDTLEVEARFKPADRGFLEEGMEALVTVDAYDFTIYGSLPAIVTRISADTIEDARGQAWYEVRVQTETSKLEKGGQELDIKPGMTVKVNVISGEKSIFDYLMKPILKSRQTGKVRGHAGEEGAEGGVLSPDGGEGGKTSVPGRSPSTWKEQQAQAPGAEAGGISGEQKASPDSSPALVPAPPAGMGTPVSGSASGAVPPSGAAALAPASGSGAASASPAKAAASEARPGEAAKGNKEASKGGKASAKGGKDAAQDGKETGSPAAKGKKTSTKNSGDKSKSRKK